MEAGPRHVLTPAPQKLRDCQPHVGAGQLGLQADPLPIKGSQAMRFDRPAPNIPGQILHDATPMGILLQEPHVPLLAGSRG
jgi:hypothetical protein